MAGFQTSDTDEKIAPVIVGHETLFAYRSSKDEQI
jgi:hypothetical protein